MGHGRYEEALESVNKALQRKKYGATLGFRASLLGHLKKGPKLKWHLINTWLCDRI